jgi:FkbM family methyltransferase
MLSTLPEVVFRPGCNDHHIWSEIFQQNVYRLPDDLSGAVCIDIGAHVGYYALACLQRGAAQVIALEPEAENFALAQAHLAPYGDRVQLSRLAVVRSDGEEWPPRMEPYFYMPDAQLYNTGSPSSFAEAGPIVESITFDELIRLVLLESPGQVDRVKIDAQGAEFPLLLTATTLMSIDRLVGEFQEHGVPGGPPIPLAMGPGLPSPLTYDLLVARLEAQGFAVEVSLTPGFETHRIGLFFAERR